MKEKTYVDDVDRSIYDIRNEEKDVYRVQEGLDASIVEKISKEKNDPAWMTMFRLQSLQIYNELKVPDWGPSIDGLDMSHIATYVRPNTKMSAKWSEVPEDIKDTFEKLGIPQAERKSLAGVGAQYDSELVYHNVREEVAAQGVVYTDMESALKGEYADMVRKYFMKLVRPNDHKFAALHGAVWSGGSFVYVPPGVSVEIPLQSYFRLNAPGAGQFEHTLIIVDEGADLHFIEGCSAPKYNVANLHLLGDRMQLFNDIGAESGKQAQIEVVQLFLGAEKIWAGSYATLTGEKSHLQLDAGYYREKQQLLDMNYVAQHIGKKTESNMNVGGVLQDASKKVFRGTIDFPLGCVGAKGDEMEDVLILGEDAINQTVPQILCAEEDVEGNHGASIGRPADEVLFYLASRGLSEEDACNLLARAKLEALCNRIGEQKIAEQAENWLWEVTGDEA